MSLEWRTFLASGIAERLRQARERKGLSRSELSTSAGLDRKTCQTIEDRQGPGNIGILTVEKLAHVLGVSPGWLAFGEEAPTAHREEVVVIERDEEEDADDEVPAARLAPEDRKEIERLGPIRAHSHRPPGLDFHELPALGRRYDPVLAALGPQLPEPRRRLVAQWMVDAVGTYDIISTPGTCTCSACSSRSWCPTARWWIWSCRSWRAATGCAR